MSIPSGESFQRVGCFLFLVVEPTIELEILPDPGQPLIAAYRANNFQTFVLRNLANNLADRASSRGDEGVFTLLWLPNLVQ